MRDNEQIMPAADTPAVAELRPHYYRDNFARLLETVENQYGDLLNAEELGFLRAWRELGFPAQCLYVRLVSRVGPWFREGRLDYPEIGPCAPALDELLAAGLLCLARELDIQGVGQLCTRDELVRAFALAPARKAELLAQIAAGEEPGTALCATVATLDGGRIVAPAGLEIVALFELLFFGNRRQGLTDFVLNDLGVARYFPYPLDRSQRLFPCREAVEEYLLFAGMADLWWQAVEEGGQEQSLALGELSRVLVLAPARHPTSERRRDRLCNRLARQLEREGEEELALQLYRQSGSHPARERAARALERLGREQEAFELVESALAQPMCEEERDAMGRIGERLRRRLDLPRSRRQRDDFTLLELPVPATDERVELAAAAQFATRWRSVHYVENALMNTLFGLAFWEQIFAALPGAFANPFQAAPLDMYEKSFAERRKEALETRLEALASGDLQAELLRACREYQGYQCRWTDWRRVDEALVAEATGAIPPAHLVAIWRRMLFDPGENRRGFPDLLAIGEEPGDYCMIEVKSPGDKLQESQKRWLRFFCAQGIPAAVAQVSWRDE